MYDNESDRCYKSVQNLDSKCVRMRFIGCQKLTFSDAIKTDVSEVKSKMKYVYILPSYMYITRGNVLPNIATLKYKGQHYSH